MTEDHRPKLVGLNHIALEVGDVDAALAFYEKIFRFELRGDHRNDAGRRVMAFIDMGDQFLALNETDDTTRDGHRHFGLVVEDREDVMALAEAAGAALVEGSSNNFRDLWGNRIEIVAYRDIQFSKTAPVLEAMGVDPRKTDAAQKQLADKDMF
ncbi:VOC family protein [Sulfitobacter sp. D35]|uniref:VOC family protein n=1 Tax=Sulfitobacter sp. D35 TaxID=3083252 RepID=UPI00296EFD63|nr:VOC family protein [Sulfitobacter sp. D35]MDW4496663.1 VOC family protein [Sulfitobacter sp. D35]